MQRTILALALASALLMPTLTEANSKLDGSKLDEVAMKLSSVGRLTKLVERRGRKLSPRGCEGAAKRVGSPNATRLSKELLRVAHTVKASCVVKEKTIVCSLVFVGQANETHDWSATLLFNVLPRSKRIPQASFSCEIVG